MLAMRWLMCWSVIFASARFATGQDRNTLVLNDRTRILDDGFWIYNDVEKGLEEAEASGKPLLVIFRCIPCEACAQLDEQVVEKNPAVRKLLSRFVCVRVVYTNGMDLSRFQFDYDQSWAAFFMNADGTIYGRYGTRSHQTESDDDVSLDGFIDTLGEVLALHRQFPKVRQSLAPKTGPAVPVARPEEFSNLKGRYASSLNYGNEVARSCIHCHQVGESWREWYRSAGKPIPEEVIYPYPHPKILGLIMDPKTAATVKQVQAGSWAETAGFKSGDELRVLNGQPIVSTADIQWVLHGAPSTAVLKAEVERGGKQQALELQLPEGWRETGDISWRVTSWAFRRMVTGGLRLVSLTSEELEDLKGVNTGVGLRVEHVGQWNAHAAAKRAGFKKDDILISIAGRSEPMSESQVFAFLIRTTKPGDQVDVELLRGGKKRQLQLPIQD